MLSAFLLCSGSFSVGFWWRLTWSWLVKLQAFLARVHQTALRWKKRCWHQFLLLLWVSAVNNRRAGAFKDSGREARCDHIPGTRGVAEARPAWVRTAMWFDMTTPIPFLTVMLKEVLFKGGECVIEQSESQRSSRTELTTLGFDYLICNRVFQRCLFEVNGWLFKGWCNNDTVLLFITVVLGKSR